MAALTPGSRAPRAGVVTVSYRSGAVLPGFLASVPAASDGPLAVVVVDNLEEGDAAAEQLATAAGARYLHLPANPGYGGAMNAGVAALPAEIEWVLLSNPDVELSPGVIDGLIATAEQSEGIGVVGPAVLNADGSVYPSARRVPSLRTGVGHALFANFWTTNPWSTAYLEDAADHTVRRDAGWLSGACVLVRRSAFESLHGFDDGYFMYFEDVDLGFRMSRLGFRNVYEPAVSVRHFGAHSTSTESDRMVAAHHQSAKRFLSKKYPGAVLWPVRLSLTIGLSLRSALVRRRMRRAKGQTS